MENNQTSSAFDVGQRRRRWPVTARQRDTREAARLLAGERPDIAGQVLPELNPGQTAPMPERFAGDFAARMIALPHTGPATLMVR